MPFNSVEYAYFLCLVGLSFWVTPRRHRPLLVLAASWVFYGLWDYRYLPLLWTSTILAYTVGRALPNADEGGRRILLGAGVVGSLTILLVFKLPTLGQATSGETFGGGAIDVIVPIGLSYFLFQAIAYVVDVHRGVQEPVESFVDFAAYLAFFPHLPAGPILRARELIPALHAVPAAPDRRRLTEGAELLLVGLYKKVAVADPILSLVATSSRDPGHMGSAQSWLVLAGAVLGNYFDITAYIDMARGSAKLLGITIRPNSIQPLTRARSWNDFWRRWQVTLMMWFRDYVFLPLRGRGRAGISREAAATFLAFVAVGVWHTLSINWLLWGTLCGTFAAIQRVSQRLRSERRRATGISASGRRSTAQRARALGTTLLLFALTLPWVMTPNPSEAAALYGGLVRSGGQVPTELAIWILLAIPQLILLDARERTRNRLDGRHDPVTAVRAVAFGLMVLAVIVFAGGETRPFVYTQF